MTQSDRAKVGEVAVHSGVPQKYRVEAEKVRLLSNWEQGNAAKMKGFSYQEQAHPGKYLRHTIAGADIFLLLFTF